MKHHALTIGVGYALFDALNQELQPQGINFVMSLDIDDGLRKFARCPYELVVMDLSRIEGNSHTELISCLRDTRNTPILLITDQCGQERELLACGADLCLPVDFPQELVVSHAAALIRRHTKYNTYHQLGRMKSAPFRSGDIYIDPLRRIVKVKDKPIYSLRPREFSLLLFFMQNPNIVLTPEQICVGAWDMENGYGGDVSAPVGILRRAIEPDPKHPVYIETVRQIGYRFTAYDSETCDD